MKNKTNFFGIFSKVFLYTMLILLLVIGSMFLFFSNQIKSAVAVTQQRQTTDVFQPLLEQLREGNLAEEEIIALVKNFHEKNTSFNFRFVDENGEVLFQTNDFADSENIPNIKIAGIVPNDGSFSASFNEHDFSKPERVLFRTGNENGLQLLVASSFAGDSIYSEILEKAVWVFGFVLLVSLFAAFVFARLIAKPIQKLSANTHAMSLLTPVDPPKEKKRLDEIGQLEKDVYTMYSRLKSTIEQQRYFFSAASHELKTPITAMGAIFEGLLENVIAPEEYPLYFKDGMKLVGEQNKLVSEILEIVKLSGDILDLEKQKINLRECVNSVIEPLTPLIEIKNQQLNVDIDNDIICELNNGLFTKALSNILLNAVQNSPTSQAAEIRVSAEEDDDFISLCVWNSDTQIPDNLLPKLFEPFYREDEARTSGNGHSGLGLTIVKKSLDLMKIDFEIDNYDNGVLFEIKFSKS